MAQGKVLHGARVKVLFGGVPVGIFTDCSYQYSIDDQEAYILGRYGPAEIALVGAQPISGNLNGWRVIDFSPFKQLGRGNNDSPIRLVPMLQDLLRHEDTTLTLVDRVTGKFIANVIGVRTLGVGSGVQNRQLSTVGIPFKGLALTDENGTSAEPGDAADLP